jgi:uncharacterized lipoprotein YmbA
MRARAAGLALAVLWLSGCAGSFQRPAPEKTLFLIALPAPPPGAKLAGTLGVDRVRVSSLFDRKGFVYRTGEQTFDSDFHFEWFAPPGAVLREAMIDWLAGGSVFASIERGAGSEAGWLLETDVDRFYADRRDPAATEVVLAGRFRVLDLRGSRPQRAFSLRFDEREPAGEGTPQALVDAWSRALDRALRALEPELRAAAGTPSRAAAR